MTSQEVMTTGYFGAIQYTMIGGYGISVFPPPAWLKAILLAAVLLEVVIWKFISTDGRVESDGTMFQWISSYGVWCVCMGKIGQFSQNFIVVSCTRIMFTVCHTHVHVYACTYPHVV